MKNRLSRLNPSVENDNWAAAANSTEVAILELAQAKMVNNE